ncbi:MAG: hypothetical protein AAF387_03100 [Pseudomonadota bacterium]
MLNHFEQKEGYIYARFEGDHLDLERLIGWVAEFLEHPLFFRSSPVLWDALSISKTDLSFGDMQTFGDFILEHRDRRGSGRSAFVCDDDLVFGLFRTHEMLNNQKYDYDYHVFRNLETARKWVSGEDK